MKKRIFLLCLLLNFSISSSAQCWNSVAVGYNNIFAIAENGTLWAWGKNSFGELGDGTNTLKNSPVQIGTSNNWKEVSPSMDGIYSFTLALKTDGTLWTWGSNNKGQLGDNTTINRNYPLQIGTDTDWKTVAAGLSHSIAIKENGTLWGWGTPERYALSVPYASSFVVEPRQIGTDSNWKQASAHDRVTVAVKTDNTVWGWGWNRNDMLNAPSGATIAGDVYYPVQKIVGTNVKETRTGDRISIDIKTNNNISQLGTTAYYVKDVDTGVSTTAYIRFDNNTLWYSGKMLGSTNQNIQGMTQLSSATNWESISVGSQCAAAINSVGEIYTWGSNSQGALGIGVNGTTTSSTVPVLVPCPSILLNTTPFETYIGLKLFPNPVQNTLNLESNKTIERLVIYDVMGKKCFDQSFDTSKVSVNCSQFSQGLYIIQAYSGQSKIQTKFIKE